MARKPPLSSKPEAPQKAAEQKASSREGRRAVAFWIDDAVYEEFQIATVRQRTTIQAAGEDMLGDWMRKVGARMPER